MELTDVLTLVAENPEAHGIFEAHAETTRTVFCVVKSVTMNEFYTSRSAGLNPVYIFRLADYAEYKGEKICVFRGVRYRIARTYVTGTAIELTVEEVTHDAD